jgi:hypothetical protein
MSVSFAFPSAEIRLGWRPGRGHDQRGVREKILAEGEPIGTGIRSFNGAAIS